MNLAEIYVVFCYAALLPFKVLIGNKSIFFAALILDIDFIAEFYVAVFREPLGAALLLGEPAAAENDADIIFAVNNKFRYVISHGVCAVRQLVQDRIFKCRQIALTVLTVDGDEFVLGHFTPVYPQAKETEPADGYLRFLRLFDEEAARRRLEREEYEMEHADDAWDDWLGGEPIEHEAEADVSASVPDLR